MRKVLILTASMGEGHNTAARNIRDAILSEAQGTAEVLVVDPYTRTNPMINKMVQQGYAVAINNYPRAWKVAFELLSRKGVVEGMDVMLASLKKAVHDLISEFQPDIIASTYPIFSFIVASLRRHDPSLKTPLYTIITDSTRVNSAWYRCPSDGCIVADEETASVLRADGVQADKIHVLGFPVNLVFENLQPAPEPVDAKWKAVFFPGGKSAKAVAVLQHLAKIENLEVTVVTGKQKTMFIAISAANMPAKGELLGWTDKMPSLMGSHHLFIGKAGGATVQEAIAARIPFLVSHIVYGQEEGNISLVQQSGIGALAAGDPEETADLVRGAMANGGSVWRAWRSNLDALATPSASRSIAKFLLDRVPA